MKQEHIEEITINATKDIVISLIENKLLYRHETPEMRAEDINYQYAAEIGKAFSVIYHQIYDCPPSNSLSPKQSKALLDELIDEYQEK